MKKTLQSVAMCIGVMVLAILIMSAMVNAADSQWEKGFKQAVEGQYPYYNGVILDYDYNGNLTDSCIAELEKTVFNGCENRLYEIIYN